MNLRELARLQAKSQAYEKVKRDAGRLREFPDSAEEFFDSRLDFDVRRELAGPLLDALVAKLARLKSELAAAGVEVG